MDARIVERKSINLAGMRCSNTARRNSIPRLWDTFLRQARSVDGLLERGTYGVYIYDFEMPHGDVDEDMPFDYLAAGEAAAAGEVDVAGAAAAASTVESADGPALPAGYPAGFERYSLPARTYAVFEHRGKLARLGATYEYIYGVWFPRSGRESLAAEHFEYHGPDFRGDFDDSVTEIWIPITA